METSRNPSPFPLFSWMPAFAAASGIWVLTTIYAEKSARSRAPIVPRCRHTGKNRTWTRRSSASSAPAAQRVPTESRMRHFDHRHTAGFSAALPFSANQRRQEIPCPRLASGKFKIQDAPLFPALAASPLHFHDISLQFFLPEEPAWPRSRTAFQCSTRNRWT